jgi:hypothetical protein
LLNKQKTKSSAKLIAALGNCTKPNNTKAQQPKDYGINTTPRAAPSFIPFPFGL